jgi:hypothetical protein
MIVVGDDPDDWRTPGNHPCGGPIKYDTTDYGTIKTPDVQSCHNAGQYVWVVQSEESRDIADRHVQVLEIYITGGCSCKDESDCLLCPLLATIAVNDVCDCPTGTYSNEGCHPCPSGYTCNGDGLLWAADGNATDTASCAWLTSVNKCACEHGFYQSPDDGCRACPDGYKCVGTELLATVTEFPRWPVTSTVEFREPSGISWIGTDKEGVTQDDITVVVSTSESWDDWSDGAAGIRYLMDKEIFTTINGWFTHSNAWPGPGFVWSGVSGYGREWIKIDFGESFVPTMLHMIPARYPERFPVDWRLYATNDAAVALGNEAVEWTRLYWTANRDYDTYIKRFGGPTNLDTVGRFFEYTILDNTETFQYYYFVFQAGQVVNDNFNIGELYFTNEELLNPKDCTCVVGDDPAVDTAGCPWSVTSSACACGSGFYDGGAVGCVVCPDGFTCHGNTMVSETVSYPRLPVVDPSLNSWGRFPLNGWAADGVAVQVVVSHNWGNSFDNVQRLVDKEIGDPCTESCSSGPWFTSQGLTYEPVPGYTGAWVKFDFGTAFVTNGMRYVLKTSDVSGLSGWTTAPKAFRIYGTNDAAAYTTHVQAEGWTMLNYDTTLVDQSTAPPTTPWIGLWNEYPILGNSESFRYYMLVVNRVTSGIQVSFSELEFLSLGTPIDTSTCTCEGGDGSVDGVGCPLAVAAPMCACASGYYDAGIAGCIVCPDGYICHGNTLLVDPRLITYPEHPVIDPAYIQHNDGLSDGTVHIMVSSPSASHRPDLHLLMDKKFGMGDGFWYSSLFDFMPVPDYSGSWVKVDFGTAFECTSIRYMLQNSGWGWGASPSAFRIYGTNDATAFTTPEEAVGWTNLLFDPRYIPDSNDNIIMKWREYPIINNAEAFRYYMLVFNAGRGGAISLTELEFISRTPIADASTCTCEHRDSPVAAQTTDTAGCPWTVASSTGACACTPGFYDAGAAGCTVCPDESICHGNTVLVGRPASTYPEVAVIDPSYSPPGLEVSDGTVHIIASAVYNDANENLSHLMDKKIGLTDGAWTGSGLTAQPVPDYQGQ